MSIKKQLEKWEQAALQAAYEKDRRTMDGCLEAILRTLEDLDPDYMAFMNFGYFQRQCERIYNSLDESLGYPVYYGNEEE